MGNTNFSIHLPRASFDRHATAQVVLRAVRSLGIDAIVNDRNDICVGKDKICTLAGLSARMPVLIYCRPLRIRIRVQDCQGPGVPPRHNAYFDKAGYTGGAPAVRQGAWLRRVPEHVSRDFLTEGQ